jgi:hypothetical protein
VSHDGTGRKIAVRPDHTEAYMLWCPMGCERDVTRFATGAASFKRCGCNGFAEQKVSVRVQPPPGMAEEYAAMTQLTPLAQSPPAVEFYSDLHGVGGIFSGNDWGILVGVGDMLRAADKVLANWYPAAEAVCMGAGSRGQRPSRPALFQFVMAAATVRCMAHELGHALITSGMANPYEPDGEAGADYYAGRLDAARGRNRQLGEMFFWSIGCVGPSCVHPRPDVRAAAYGAGYGVQLVAA